jgi:glyoxylase-like metal-dependent hydrolase (beta-lactamase superfamily II)
MVSELGDGVWWIDLGSVNAYLVDDDVLTLIDAGLPWHSGEIVDAIVEAGFTLSDLDRALVTHYDADHVGGLERLEGLGASVYAGTESAPLVAGRRSPGWDSHKAITQSVARLFYSDTDVEVMGLADGESIGSFTVYDTPGHTSGHVAYVSESLGVCLLGDLVVEDGGVLSPSPWYLCHDSNAVPDSIRRLVARARPFETLCMGHGRPIVGDGRESLEALAAER